MSEDRVARRDRVGAASVVSVSALVGESAGIAGAATGGAPYLYRVNVEALATEAATVTDTVLLFVALAFDVAHVAPLGSHIHR